MKEIAAEKITEEVARLCQEANFDLGEDVMKAFKDFRDKEESGTCKEVLGMLIENAELAARDRVPICQDTGLAVFFVEMGQDVHVTGKCLFDAINDGVKKGYTDGYLRKSCVRDPLDRKSNTGDNSPAIVWTETVPGDKLVIKMAPKGGGSENMSEVKMLTPAAGADGIKDFVVDRISRSGANPCPPIVVGVGIGGTFEKVAWLAKKSLLREIGSKNPNEKYAKMEEELLESINKLGIGPQGFGGTTTALAVHIEVAPCHIASMPCSVNVQCHAARHKEVVL